MRVPGFFWGDLWAMLAGVGGRRRVVALTRDTPYLNSLDVANLELLAGRSVGARTLSRGKNSAHQASKL